MMWLILVATALYANAETVDGFHYYEGFCITRQNHELADAIITGVTIEECVAHCKATGKGSKKCRSLEFNPSDGECRPQKVKRPPTSDCTDAREGDKFYSPLVHKIFGFDPTKTTTTSLPPASSKGCTDLAGPGMATDWKDPEKCVMTGMYEEKEQYATMEACEETCLADDKCNAIYYEKANEQFSLCASHICVAGKDSKFVPEAKMQGQYKLCEKENIAIAKFDIGGSAILNGAEGVVVQVNYLMPDAQTKALTGDGDFTFDNQMSSGDRYDVTIKRAPMGYSCRLGDRRYSGSINADVTNVVVICSKRFWWDTKAVGKRDDSCDDYCDFEGDVCFDCAAVGCLQCGVQVQQRSHAWKPAVAMIEQSEWSVEDVAMYSFALVGVGAFGYTAYNAAFSPKPVTMHESYTEDC